MAAEKVRVYELAKKLGLSNKEILTSLEEKLGLQVKSHSSTITHEEANKLESLLKTPKAAPKKIEKQEVVPIKKETEKPVSQVQSKPIERPIEQNKPQQRTDMPQQRQGFVPRPDGQRQEFQQRQGFAPRPDGQRQSFAPRPDSPPRQDGAPRPGFQQRQGFAPRPDGQRQGFAPRPGFTPRPDGPPRQDGAPRPGFQQRQGFAPRPDGPQRQGFAPRPGFSPRPDGPQRQGFAPRPGFTPRPEGSLPAADGDKPFRFKQPIKRQFITPDMTPPGAGMAPRGIAPDKFANKKKEKKVAFGLTKEEKQEQAKLLQQQQKYKKKTKNGEEIQEKVTEIIIDKPITVGEFADKMGVPVSEVVKTLMLSGIFATVNQTLDLETATKVAETFEVVVIKKSIEEPEKVEEKIAENASNLSPRAPVVTIMGHVDHGKTTLLDSIRAIKHKIVSGEVGGITQSIGAYSVKINDKKIVFIDTPGHEAFTAMRARGAKATDVAILVVAADDGIMPQTIEAINHAKAANVPIIVAVNKMDKPGADPDRVLTQLTEHGLVPEDWGGETICVKVSALLGDGIDELLEYILLVSEVLELKANPSASATGVVIEAKLDKGKGPVATLLVQNGTLKKGDCIVVGNVGGKIRALISDEGARLEEVGPSTPVEILGLSEVPQAGDSFEISSCEREMKTLVSSRKDIDRETKLESMAPAQIRKEMMAADHKEAKNLNIIIKANTHGSAEAVSASIQQLQSKQIFTKIVHIGVGDISEADVMLASASNAIIIGFSVKEDQNAARVASQEGIEIKKYEIIYQILEDIEKTMLGLIKPEFREVEVGVAEVRQVFTIGKFDKIAGCYVIEGKIIRNKPAIVERKGKQIFKGNLDQLKRFKDDAKEVNTGYECGISFSKFNDLEEGDLIRVFITEEIEKQLVL